MFAANGFLITKWARKRLRSYSKNYTCQHINKLITCVIYLPLLLFSYLSFLCIVLFIASYLFIRYFINIFFILNIFVCCFLINILRRLNLFMNLERTSSLTADHYIFFVIVVKTWTLHQLNGKENTGRKTRNHGTTCILTPPTQSDNRPTECTILLAVFS